ncbi:MAG: hypothetical protein B7X10_00795, partial [Burkholderiales bacterium 21-58-4]
TFLDAGHILGSAMVQLRINDDGEEKIILFTGDLGRKGLPILRNPEVVEEADTLITESTYGGRHHDPIQGMQAKLQEVILRTVRRGGKVIIPAFSVERTQEITYTLHRLFDSKSLPRIPVFVDSPLSVNATEVFRLHPECFNKDIFKMVLAHDDPFGFEYIKYIRLVEDSKKLNDMKEPMVIISASGMCESGRILHHLANNAGNPNNTILIAAGDDGNALSTLYKGYMTDSWSEMREAPNTALVVMAATGAVTAVRPVNASSYIGPTQVSGVMADLAAEAGFGFENNGVQVTLDSPYLPGTTLAKIQACARAAGIYYTIRQGVLVIWPVGATASQDVPIIISPATGLVGYPTFSQSGVSVRCLLNPSIQFGKKFTISGSILTPANRDWNPYSIEHNIESQAPNGDWFTDVTGYWADE